MKPLELQKLVAEMLAAAATHPSLTPSPTQVREEEEESEAGTLPKKKKSSLGRLLGKRAATAATLTADQKGKAEMSIYLHEMAIDGEEDPLTWWKANQGPFPLMANIMCKYLCICATSAPAEHVFITAGIAVTPLHSLLKPEKCLYIISCQKP